MTLKNYILLTSILLISFNGKGQYEKPASGIQITVGTLHVYRTLSIGIENNVYSFLKGKHQIRCALNIGVWQARLY